MLDGSLKAKGFGDGKCRRNHPQAALEAATLPSYKSKFDRLLLNCSIIIGTAGLLFETNFKITIQR